MWGSTSPFSYFRCAYLSLAFIQAVTEASVDSGRSDRCPTSATTGSSAKPCAPSAADEDTNSMLQSKVLREEPKGSSLAICVSGGMRGADKCAASLVDTMIRPNLGRLDKVDLFVATWSERQCSNRSTTVDEKQVREIYSKAGVNITGLWIGSSEGAGIPKQFKDTWTSNKPQDYPFADMGMLDGTHHMAKLWRKCLDMVPSDYDVIVHARPDQHFPAKYSWKFENFGTKMNGWHAEILNSESNAAWSEQLQDGTVYMSENKYHKPSVDNVGTIPDDRLGFGLAAPMRGVFATMDVAADEGEYDVSKQKYRLTWGAPEPDNPDQSGPNQKVKLNPRHAWVRERYPEKLLKHHILQQQFNYSLISDSAVSPYDIVTLEKEC